MVPKGRSLAWPVVVGLMAASISLAANAQSAETLPFDTPTMVEGIETVCTGVGQDAQTDPRWAAYPLKVVVAGEGGQYLGDVGLTVAQNGKSLVQLRCRGPWILFKLPPGQYAVSASLENATVKANVGVNARGQGRVILRFPSVGGTRSSEHVPAVN